MEDGTSCFIPRAEHNYLISKAVLQKGIEQNQLCQLWLTVGNREKKSLQKEKVKSNSKMKRQNKAKEINRNQQWIHVYLDLKGNCFPYFFISKGCH